ncbi:MAG: hypothetical protein WA667_26020 [Candidatus Nitrosopolaris sp.]
MRSWTLESMLFSHMYINEFLIPWKAIICYLRTAAAAVLLKASITFPMTVTLKVM